MQQPAKLLQGVETLKKTIWLFTLSLSLFSFLYAFPDCTPKFKHTITYTRKGSRSESRHGQLLINGNPVADAFNIVSHGTIAYKFYQRKNLWGLDGYFPIEIPTIEKPDLDSQEEFAADMLDLGWHLGNVRYKNTPQCWIFVQWGKGSAFVDAGKLDAFVNYMKLKKLPRQVSVQMKRHIER